VGYGPLVLFADAGVGGRPCLSGVLRMNTRYDMGDGLYLEFSEAVAETFQRYRQRQSANEAGGILMGQVYPGSYVVVEMATTPGPGGNSWGRSRYAQLRGVVNTFRLQMLIDLRYRTSPALPSCIFAVSLCIYSLVMHG
jgi:hypothetical protein